MSILLLEGFDDGLWTSRTGGNRTTTHVSSSYGLHGNGGRVGDTTGINMSVGIPSSGNEGTVGFAFKIVDGIGGTMMATWRTSYMYLAFDEPGSRVQLHITCTSTATVESYSPGGSVAAGEWHYVEVQAKAGLSSDGTWAWWLDGTLIGSGTGADYGSVNDSSVDIGGSATGDIDDMYIDDIYVIDALGGVNDDHLGPIEVVTLLPSGNGNSSVLVGSDADSTDNYLLVDNNASAPPVTTEYVGSATEGDKDTYAMGDLTGTPVVAGLVVALYAVKTDAGAKFMRPVVRTSSTDYPGDSEGLAETYSLHEHVWDQNPNTSAAWLYGAVNGMEVGQEVRDS